MNKIVYFSKDDLISHSMMEKIDIFFKTQFYISEPLTINDLLERYHIKEYFDNGMSNKNWTVEQLISYRTITKGFDKDFGIYFTTIEANDIINIYDNIYYEYLKTFWIFLNKYRSFEKLIESDLNLLLLKQNFHIQHLLQFKRVVDHFDDYICACLISKPHYAEILLQYFEASQDRIQNELFFPKSLTITKREELILTYLDTEDPNLNYVRLIVKNKDSDHLKFTDKTKLKAKRIANKINEKLFSSENVITIRKGVCLSEDQEEAIKIIYENDQEIVSYSKKRLLDDIGNTSLFLNFKKVFEFIDFQGCIKFVTRKFEIDTFELSLMRSKNEYFISSAFRDNNVTSAIRFELYKYFLDSVEIKIEDLLQNFVNTYLNEKYNVDFLTLHLPSRNSSYLEKIRLLVPEFESILEQYKLYVEDDNIDYELLQVSTKTSKLHNIPSLLEKKYVYPLGDEYSKLEYNFFNNMSVLFDYEKFGKKYQNFYHLLTSEIVYISDFIDYRRNYVQHFIDENYLKINEDNSISLININLMIIIGYLKIYDVISYWHFPKFIRDEIELMEKMKIVRFSHNLLTIDEQKYFDYYLNNRYSNGLWLRNKYVHATNSHVELEQKNDYKILLKLMILLVLKIDDDLQLGFDRIKLAQIKT